MDSERENRASRRAILKGAPALAVIAAVAAETGIALASVSDPAFGAIAHHSRLRQAAEALPDDDDGPVSEAAWDREEVALQAIGTITPTTIGGAAAMLEYMAEVEGCYCDNGSPFLPMVKSVAAGLRILTTRETARG